MARKTGTNGYLTAEGAEVGQRISFNLTLTVAELEANTQGATWTDADAGLKSAKGDVEVFYDPADTGQDHLVVGAIVSLELFPSGNSTGNEKIAGEFLVTEVGLPSQVGELIKKTITVVNKGTVAITTVA
jgi:hypothetical protein